MSMLHVVLLPGKGHTRHNHPDADEILYILAGHGEQMVDDGKPFAVAAGPGGFLPPRPLPPPPHPGRGAPPPPPPHRPSGGGGGPRRRARFRACAAGAPLGRPDVVVRPHSDEEVAAVVRLANHHQVPVVPWGGGSGTQGASIPTRGGIVVDLTGMDRIVEVDEHSMTVTAEAGVNGKRLQSELHQKGLMLPPHPPSPQISTVRR